MAPKPTPPKPKHVPVSDLRVGQKISGRVYDADSPRPEVVGLKKPIEVKTIEVCPGQRRTHLHLNGSQCWDGRTLVEVK